MISEEALRLGPAEPEDAGVILTLDGMATAASNDFIFETPEQSLAVRRLLLERGAAEYAPPNCRVVRTDGRTVGYIAVLRADEVRKRRLRAALVLQQAGSELISPVVRDRLRKAGAAVVPVGTDDAFFSRIAVLADYAGKGLGRWLQERAIEWGTSLGARRLLFNVADTNPHALALYLRRGCVEIGRAVAEDPGTSRRLGYIHLALPLV